MLAEKDLVGVWRLVAHFYLEDDGSTSEGPMGDRADGLLIYHEDGYMAASLMRTEPLTGENRSAAATYLGSTDDYLGYSGRWYVRDDTVVHEVVIGSHPRVVNTEQVREVSCAEGGLRLLRRLGGPHDYVVMDWRRAEPAASTALAHRRR
jgi:Lipocalin-like domain